MFSKDKEFILFQGEFLCEGEVEKWLTSLEFKTKESLELILNDAKLSYEDMPREEWVGTICA